ncbi:MAG: CoA ester lyase, partial [Actinomycetota bacterium]
ADAVIVDLEDAVPAGEKEEARAHACAWVSEHPEAWVRVNGGSAMNEDVRALVAAGARKLYVPKASLEALDALPDGVEATALLETAAGVLDARAIAVHPRVVRLAIGEADLGAELGVTDPRAFEPMRALIVLASAAAGIDPPVGPISADFRDVDALIASTRALKAAGFGARAAIHPAQVAVINDVFTPSREEVARARRIIELADAAGGAATLDDEGRMIDEAMVRGARRVLGPTGLDFRDNPSHRSGVPPDGLMFR